MAVLGGKPRLLCAFLALAAMAQLTAARSVPTAEPEEYVIEVDAEAVSDDGGEYVVETESDIAIEDSQEDTRAKRKLYS